MLPPCYRYRTQLSIFQSFHLHIHRLPSAKSQAVPHHTHTAECHCCTRDHRREQHTECRIQEARGDRDEERYCADVMVQIASVQEALSGVGKILLQNHLRHCTTDAIRSGDPAEA